jgi:hypothetical protein
MAKIKYLPNIDEETGQPFNHPQYLYWCEGCGYEHAFALLSEGGHHKFNGDLNNPFVAPSLVEDKVPNKRCHSHIEHGFIRYLGDCWHHLKNDKIELPDVDQRIAERLAKARQQNNDEKI